MKFVTAAWALTKKDLRVYLRDRAALCLGFLVPIALVTVFGWIMTYAFGGSSGMPAVELWIVDEDQSDASKRLVQSLHESPSLKVRPKPSSKPVTRESVRQLIVDGEAHHAVIIPKGYSDSLRSESNIPESELVMLRDPGRELEERLIQMSLMQVMMTDGQGQLWKRSLHSLFQKRGMNQASLEQLDNAMMQMNETIERFVAEDEREGTETTPPVQPPSIRDDASVMNESERANSTRNEGSADPMEFMSEMVSMSKEDIAPPMRPKRVTYQRAQSVSGMAVMMLLFGLTGAGSILLAEKEMGTLKRLFGLPIPRESVLLGKFLFLVLIGLAQMLVLFVYGELMFQVGMFRDPLSLAVIVITWVIAATGFGMLITTFSKSAKQADGLSTICILSMAALGGCWFPLQMMNLPTVMEIVCKSMMTYWAMEGFQGMLWNSLTIFDSKIMTAVAIQWVWIVVLALLSVHFFRRNFCRA